MTPSTPSVGRVDVFSRKAVEQLRREVAVAPEQMQARRLRAEVEAHLRDHPAQPTGRRLLFLTPRSWSVHVQWEAVLAQALRVRGAHVDFLTCGGGLEVCDRVNCYEGPPVPCRSCTRYVDDALTAHGFGHHPLRTFWDSGDDIGEEPWPELDEMGVAELLDADADGLPLGRLVDVPVKWFLLGTDLDADPLAPVTRRRFLRSARRVARAIGRALDELAPDTLVELNGLFFFESIAAELARRRGIEVVSYERGFVAETLFFSRGQPAVSFDVGEAWERWRHEPLTDDQERRLTEYLDDRRRGRRVFAAFSGSAPPKMKDRGRGRLVTLFTNITWDSAVIGREAAFPSIQNWLCSVVDAFVDRPRHQLIIRVHPAEIKLPGKETREPLGPFLGRRYPSLPPNISILGPGDPTSSYALMDMSDAGLVYSSTAGLEMALGGLPVITAARSHYRGKGFTLDPATSDDFVAQLDGVLAEPSRYRPDLTAARRYAYTFFFRCLIPSAFVTEPIPGLARIQATIDDLAPGGDAGLERICAALLGGCPFDQEQP